MTHKRSNAYPSTETPPFSQNRQQYSGAKWLFGTPTVRFHARRLNASSGTGTTSYGGFAEQITPMDRHPPITSATNLSLYVRFGENWKPAVRDSFGHERPITGCGRFARERSLQPAAMRLHRLNALATPDRNVHCSWRRSTSSISVSWRVITRQGYCGRVSPDFENARATYAATALISSLVKTCFHAGIAVPSTPWAMIADSVAMCFAPNWTEVRSVAFGSRKLPIQFRPVPSAAWQKAQFF